MRLFVFAAVFVVAACSDRISAPIVPSAVDVGTPQTVFVGTTRSKTDDGVFGIARSPDLSLLELTVTLPPGREPGSISDGRETPNPARDFTLARMTEFGSNQDFRARLAREVAKAQNNPERDVTIYVHGYNNSFSDSAFRMAQLTHDLGIEGPVVTYSWPSRGNPLGYEYDSDSAMFGRQGLIELVREVDRAGARRIIFVGHSMGARLVMETLREFELTNPGWVANSMAGILLISPDVNVDVFRSQTAAFTKWPQPFVIFSSQRDALLRLSARLRGEDRRLGNLGDLTQISDMPITFVDVTAFEDGQGNHFVAGTSASFIKIVRMSPALDTGFVRGHETATTSVFGSSRVIGKVVKFEPMAGER